ncbi:MAG: lipoyl synthase, partial [Thermoleophilia bacterium]
AGTATFLILGATCTRGCRFCAVDEAGGSKRDEAAAGSPAAAAADVCAPDPDEPRRVAEAARRLGLRHVVITSVTRDDLPDGGAGQFAAAVAAVRAASAAATVEVLIPDLGGDAIALGVVLTAGPDVLNHNLETVPRLYPEVRPQAAYTRSLQLLKRAALWAREAPPAPAGLAAARSATVPPRPKVKSGLMVGLGEAAEEVDAVLADGAAAGVDVITIGQYLRPHRGCLPVSRYVDPAEFAAWERRGAALGLRVQAAPFVRSSYHAGEIFGGSR